MGRGLHKIRNVAAVAVAAGALTVGMGGVAQADPTGCSTGFTNDGQSTYAYCTGGTGEFRAVVYCFPYGMDYGPWIAAAPNASTSVAVCPGNTSAGSAGIQTRG